MATLFLEPDDEITIAVGRIHEAGDRSVALVLPAGSRIASGRINFRLLAREAEALGVQLAVVSPEATARALASAAGLPTFSQVSRYEAAIAGGVVAAGEPEEGDEGRGGGPGASPTARTGMGPAPGPAPGGLAGRPPPRGPSARAAPVDRSPTVVAPPPEAETYAEPAVRRPRGRGLPSLRGRGLRVGLVALLVVAVGAGGAAGAYFLLPEARVTITPRIESFGTVFEATADPDVTNVDVAAGIVPAGWQETTVQAQATFPATGVKVTETKATGSVTFSWSGNQTACVVPAGARVETKAKVRFATASALTLPRADTEPSSGSVDVEAVKAGTTGNVAAGTITRIVDFPTGCTPPSLLSVTNPQPTTGGSRLEEKVVEQSDYDAAVQALIEQLQASFDEWVAGGAGLDAAGSLLIDESKALDEPRFDQPAEDLVGQVVDAFDLAAEADGRILAVDADALVALGVERYRQKVLPAGYTEVTTSASSQRIASDDPTKPRFEIIATGRAYRDLDAPALKALIVGRPVDEARAALQPYGDATVILDPDWFGIIPQLDWRVSITIAVPAGAS